MSAKKARFPTKSIQQFLRSDEKIVLLTGRIGKAYKVCNLFLFTWSSEFPPFFQTWILARGQYLRMLITFFRSEIEAYKHTRSCRKILAVVVHGCCDARKQQNASPSLLRKQAIPYCNVRFYAFVGQPISKQLYMLCRGKPLAKQNW